MKTKQKNYLKTAETMSKISKFESLKISGLSAAITMLMAIAISPALHSADIEIYKVPEDSVGQTTLLLMLDTSGSMAWNMHNTSNASAGNSRLDILKNGLKDVLEGTPTITRVDDKVVMGLATFSGNNGFIRVAAKPLGEPTGEQVLETTYIKPLWYRYEKNEGSLFRPNYVTYYNACTSWDLNNDNCLTWSGETKNVPTGFSTSSPNKTSGCSYGSRNCTYIWAERYKYRDLTHRDTLLTSIKNLTANGGTPTPYAYAEAAAYMMGTNTLSTITYYNQIGNAKNDSNKSDWWQCNTNNTNDIRLLGTEQVNVAWCGQQIGTNKNMSSDVQAKITSGDYSVVINNGRYIVYDKTLKTTLSSSGYSGFSTSIEGSKNTTSYKMPDSIAEQLTNNDKKECSGQGIYFLTDGEPEPGGTAPGSNGKSGTAYQLMTTALADKGSLFSCSSSQLGNRTGYKNSNHAWNCTGNLAQALLDPNKNPAGLQIKTAVVGFSSSFSSDKNVDVQDAKTWGTIGGGGWYVGTNSQSVVDSINAFLKDINKDIPSMSTGSATIPIDALSTRTIQPYAYSPQFEPKVKPSEKQQLWYGNLKKYHAVNNGIYGNKNGTGNPVVKESKLQDLADIWTASLTYEDGFPVFAKHGMLSQLVLGLSANSTTSFSRKIITDFEYDGTKSQATRYGRNLDLVRINPDYTTNNKTKSEKTYARALMALFGYQIAEGTETEGLNLSTLTPTLRQLGSIQHSLPVLLTQQGKAIAKRNTAGDVVVEYEDREDYVMFGSTQGLLHVVDAETGKEKFAFLPKEMIEKQSETFKDKAGSANQGKDALYYGVDGQWVAHTVYVTKPDGTQTVKASSREVIGAQPDQSGKVDVENFNGKQWVYGGLRMGGRSYYALDLTNIDSPKLKFHIDPSTGKVYTPKKPEGTVYKAIESMGQSWSKPTLGYVNWKGSRKLVMFVGGGYDAGGTDGDGNWSDNQRIGYAGYEDPIYQQTNKRGAGVYMFDADTGDLLWHAKDTGADANNGNLKYSVVSEIKTVDRNNDGYIDHLYFGDLAGQAFRVDFKNDAAFSTQVRQILDLHETNGKSPRFYVAPTFTAHRSGTKKEGANIVVAAFVSGNKSSPLLATTDSPTIHTNSLGFKYDGLYAVYDYDIYEDKSGFPTSNAGVRVLASETDTLPSHTKLKYINGATTGALVNATKDKGWGGWYYQFNTKMNGAEIGAAVIKGLTDLIAMEGNLYVTMYDASDNGTTSSCGAGVKGHSFARRICLPTGVCPDDAAYTYNLGSGIVSLNVGKGNGLNEKAIYVPDPKNVCVGDKCSPCVGKDCSEEFIPAGGTPRLVPNRWYERFSKG